MPSSTASPNTIGKTSAILGTQRSIIAQRVIVRAMRNSRLTYDSDRASFAFRYDDTRMIASRGRDVSCWVVVVIVVVVVDADVLRDGVVGNGGRRSIDEDDEDEDEDEEDDGGVEEESWGGPTGVESEEEMEEWEEGDTKGRKGGGDMSYLPSNGMASSTARGCCQ